MAASATEESITRERRCKWREDHHDGEADGDDHEGDDDDEVVLSPGGGAQPLLRLRLRVRQEADEEDEAARKGCRDDRCDKDDASEGRGVRQVVVELRDDRALEGRSAKAMEDHGRPRKGGSWGDDAPRSSRG